MLTLTYVPMASVLLVGMLIEDLEAFVQEARTGVTVDLSGRWVDGCSARGARESAAALVAPLMWSSAMVARWADTPDS